jgi:opacity protein-like surface antigen
MRLSIIASVSLSLIAFVAAPAFAQEAANPSPDAPQAEAKKDSGLELGARLGYALPFGKVADMQKGNLSDGITGQVPLILDIGYRINPNFYVGGYGQFGYGLVNSDSCPSASGVSCSAQSYRIGVNVHYHIMPDQAFDPWVGIGTGYEWLHVSESKGSDSAGATVRGFEIVNLQLGGDYHLARNATIGPFASFSIGQYSNASSSRNGTDVPGDTSIQNTALHEWLTLGVRGRFDL